MYSRSWYRRKSSSRALARTEVHRTVHSIEYGVDREGGQVVKQFFKNNRRAVIVGGLITATLVVSAMLISDYRMLARVDAAASEAHETVQTATNAAGTAPPPSGALADGEIRTGPCTTIIGHPGYNTETIRGERVQTLNGEWAIASKIISIDRCQPEQSQGVETLPDIRTIADGPKPAALRACSSGYVVEISADDRRNALNEPCVSR